MGSKETLIGIGKEIRICQRPRKRLGSPILPASPDLSNVNTAAPDYVQEATVPLGTETHGGEDVAIYARGPSAYLFHGVLEQNVIFHVMMEALRLNPK
jgi:alkaline phosphatase